MHEHKLAQTLLDEIQKIPVIDSHSHIDPHHPASRTLDDILGYHYYTELAHSAGMSKACLAAHVAPQERVRDIMMYMARFDNTAQAGWFLEIAHSLLGYKEPRLRHSDAAWLWDKALKVMARPDWEDHVLQLSHIEKVFLTNDFDDPLKGFDTNRYVPCLRTDDLVFRLEDPHVQERLSKATDIEPSNPSRLRQALAALFEHFKKRGARACAVSLPPDFAPDPAREANSTAEPRAAGRPSSLVFWMLAELCRDFGLPFDLMIGVNRRVYEQGVHQGQDLFDQRTSLIGYAKLFNAFPEVTFCISTLSSVQNQELVSYSWIFPNVVTHGHWWYSNIPAYISGDLRARLQAVPLTKQIGYYSDMYKLEFGLPKFNMYRRILAGVLADDYVAPGILGEAEAIGWARHLLRDNAREIFKV